MNAGNERWGGEQLLRDPMTDRRRFLHCAALAFAGLPMAASAQNEQNEDPWQEALRIAARITAPRFADRRFDITAYGAHENTDASTAIAQAIAACNAAGGGHVIVPPGRFLTGPIHLQSNVDLHVEKDATLAFIPDPARYLPLVPTRWEGVELMNYSPLIYAWQAENIAVTGSGTLDGGADETHWWPWKGIRQYGWHSGAPDQSVARDKLFAMGQASEPVSKRIFGTGAFLRPGFFEPTRCRNVLIEGVTLLRSPFWQVHPVLCSNVIIRRLTVSSPGPNTDGCDPESCRDVLIEDCTFSTGDDCIAIKSGRNGDGRRIATPCENILIRRCRMKDGHGALTIGSEISGGVRNLFAEDCALSSPHLDYGIRFKNNAMRGGRLEHFHFRRIAIGEVARAAITIDFGYEEGGRGPFTPVLNDVTIEKLVCAHSHRALDLRGLPNAPARAIHLTDCDFTRTEEADILHHIEGLQMLRVRENGRPG